MQQTAPRRNTRRTNIAVAVVFLAVILSGAADLFGQGTRSDYERALGLRKATAKKVFKSRVDPRWLDDGRRFWYRNDFAGGGREYVLVDAEKGTRVPASDLGALVPALAGAAGSLDPCWKERRSRDNGEETGITFVNRTKDVLDIFWIDREGERHSYGTIPAGGTREQHTFAGHVWLVTPKVDGKRDRKGAVFVAREQGGEAVIAEKTLRPIKAPSRRKERKAERTVKSPDGKWSAFVREDNIFLRRTGSGKEVALTADGTDKDGFAGGIHWSPDSKRLVALRVRKGFDRKVHLIESSPKDRLQPKLHTFSYRKPGDAIDLARPVLFEIAGRRKIVIDDALFPNPWSISRVRWSPDSKEFTFLYNERGHQVLRVVAVDARMGKARAVIDETSRTFVDYAGKLYLHHLEGTAEIIWMSERDGWNHLYLYDGKSGCMKNRITGGEWVVRGVECVDEGSRRIWFFAGGIRPGQDPYYRHLCRVDFDGSHLVVLTEGEGTHSVEFSPDRRCFVDRYSRVDMPPVTELRCTADGELLCELERADWSALRATGWRPPEPFVAKGRDGKTDIFGIVILPGRFDPAGSYPVIEQIYAGPHGAFVPKAFGLQTRQHALAELGFIVVQIDGMGTSQRSKAFHDVCWKNLGDAGFPDRILWMKAAAKKYPAMDLTRVGIYGGSAGGQSTVHALLTHPGFYKVGVADCGCHDNRMDKIWWNELWMGWPIGPHYAEQSNVTQAHRLEGKLLLTVGELDRNVDPSSTMQVVDALIKADKDFDLLIVPGGGHGVGETPYANRRRMDFFVRHLFGVEPRALP